MVDEHEMHQEGHEQCGPGYASPQEAMKAAQAEAERILKPYR